MYVEARGLFQSALSVLRRRGVVLPQINIRLLVFTDFAIYCLYGTQVPFCTTISAV
jgi:hypothetical protein